VKSIDILRQRFELEHLLSAAPSVTGAALDRAQGKHTYRPDLGKEATQDALARLVLLTRGLTPLEEAVCRARLLGVGERRQVERLVTTEEAPLKNLQEGALPCRVTRQGEEVVTQARDGQGKPVADRWVAYGLRADPPQWTVVGLEAGCSARDARNLFASAVEKTSRVVTRMLKEAA